MLDNSGKQKLIKYFKDNVSKGNFESGNKVKSTQELAKQFHIAIPTAHAALKMLEEEGIITRQRGRGTFIAANSQPGKDFQTVIIIDKMNQNLRHLVSSIIIELKTLQISPELIEYESPEKIQGKELRDKKLDCVIVMGQASADRILEQDPTLPTITFSESYQPEFPGICIAANHCAAVYHATRHMIDLGHQRIGCFAVGRNSQMHSSMKYLWHPTLTGYSNAMLDARIDYNEICQVLPKQIATSALKEFLAGPERPTAVVCQHDPRAMELIEVAEGLNLQVPGELAVISVGNSPLAQTHGLTSYDLSIHKMPKYLKCVVNLLLLKLAPPCPVHHVLQPELFIRNSCGHRLKNGTSSEEVKDWHRMIEQEAL